jgi:hypothetical protein
MNPREREAVRQSHLMAQLLAPRADPAPLVTRESGPRALRGLQAYRANADASAARALGTAFPTVHALVGADDFEHLSREYRHACPPTLGDLGEWGPDFADWLARHPQLRAWPYLGDCARLDWAMHRCERAEDNALDSASIARLGDTDPQHLVLELAAHLALVESAWPIGMILCAHRDGDDASFAAVREAIAAQRAETVLVARNGWRAQADVIDAGAAAWMRDLFAGAPLAAALAGAADGFDFTAWLTHAIQAGWLKGIRVERD